MCESARESVCVVTEDLGGWRHEADLTELGERPLGALPWNMSLRSVNSLLYFHSSCGQREGEEGRVQAGDEDREEGSG